MSKTMNRVFLMGRLGARPELKTSKTGRPYARLSVATDRYQGKEALPKTEWHSVFVFGNEAETCHRHLNPGAQVFVEGSLSYWQLEGESSDKKYKNAINADRVNFISYGRTAEGVDNSGTSRNHNAVAQL